MGEQHEPRGSGEKVELDEGCGNAGGGSPLLRTLEGSRGTARGQFQETSDSRRLACAGAKPTP